MPKGQKKEGAKPHQEISHVKQFSTPVPQYVFQLLLAPKPLGV